MRRKTYLVTKIIILSIILLFVILGTITTIFLNFGEKKGNLEEGTNIFNSVKNINVSLEGYDVEIVKGNSTNNSIGVTEISKNKKLRINARVNGEELKITQGRKWKFFNGLDFLNFEGKGKVIIEVPIV